MTNYAERFLLLQALIVRRVPSSTRITSVLLMEALQADHDLVKEHDDQKNISEEVDACVDVGLIEDGAVKQMKNRWTRPPVCKSYRRTPLGDNFLNSLEPKFQEALGNMPMSDTGVLDFLSLI